MPTAAYIVLAIAAVIMAVGGLILYVSTNRATAQIDVGPCNIMGAEPGVDLGGTRKLAPSREPVEGPSDAPRSGPGNAPAGAIPPGSVGGVLPPSRWLP